MMGAIGVWHWLIVIGVFVVLFGRNVVSSFLADLGKGLGYMRKLSDWDGR